MAIFKPHNGHMAIWLFDAIMAIWPYSHLAILAQNVDNMGVFRNSYENVTIWRTLSQINLPTSNKYKIGPKNNSGKLSGSIVFNYYIKGEKSFRK